MYMCGVAEIFLFLVPMHVCYLNDVNVWIELVLVASFSSLSKFLNVELLINFCCLMFSNGIFKLVPFLSLLSHDYAIMGNWASFNMKLSILIIFFFLGSV